MEENPKMIVGSMVAMSIVGAAGIPGRWAQIEADLHQAKNTCRQTRWNMHRTAQLDELVRRGDEELRKDIEPARIMAETTRKTWNAALSQMNAGRRIFYINVAVLSLISIIYVFIVWLILMRKREILKEAFKAAYEVKIAGAFSSLRDSSSRTGLY